MAAKPGLGTYLAAAFNARPLGMPLPPNWVGLAAFGLLGLLNPGLWLVGAGLEAAYLVWLAHNQRFRAVVDGRALGAEQVAGLQTVESQLARLGRGARERYQQLADRCREILAHQAAGGAGEALAAQEEGLNRLAWIFLRLLQALESIHRLTEGGDSERERLDVRARDLETRLAGGALADDLRKSLTAQLDIIRQRQAKRHEASDKRAFVQAELTRIVEQVELIREQAMLSTDPRAVSARIDEVAAGLGGTSDWIRDQQRLVSEVEDIAGTPPPLLRAAPPTQGTSS